MREVSDAPRNFHTQSDVLPFSRGRNIPTRLTLQPVSRRDGHCKFPPSSYFNFRIIGSSAQQHPTLLGSPKVVANLSMYRSAEATLVKTGSGSRCPDASDEADMISTRKASAASRNPSTATL